jgi:O-antigen ligase
MTFTRHTGFSATPEVMTRGIVIRAIVLVLFLNAAIFKAAVPESCPVDVTMVLAGICAGFCIYDVRKRGLPVGTGLFRTGLLFMAFALPILWTDWTDYSTRKVASLFTFTLLAALAPVIQLRSAAHLRAVFLAQAGFSLFLAFLGAFVLFRNSSVEQLTVFGANTITFGRNEATAGIWFLALLMDGNHRMRGRLIAGAGLMVALCLASGSRGALFACVIVTAFLSCIAVSRRRSLGRTILSLLAIMAFIAGALLVAAQIAPERSVARVEAFLDGTNRSTGREALFSIGSSAALETPFGKGWGASQELNPYGNSGRFYFHNIVLELAVEAGWLAAVLLLWVLAAAVRSCTANLWHGCSSEQLCLAAWLLFYIIGAMLSGDINDNRWLFALISLALEAPHWAPKRATAAGGRPRAAVSGRALCAAK